MNEAVLEHGSYPTGWKVAWVSDGHSGPGFYVWQDGQFRQYRGSQFFRSLPDAERFARRISLRVKP